MTTESFDEAKALIDQFNQEIEDFKKKKQELVLNIGQKPFLSAFQVLKQKVPEVTSVHWTQFTPYWNDGEECTFRVNDWNYNVEIDGEEIEGEGGYPYDGFFNDCSTPEEIEELKLEIQKAEEKYKKDYDSWNAEVPKRRYHEPYNYSIPKKESLARAIAISEKYTPEKITEIKQALYDFNKFLTSVPDELYEDIFGDHCQVIITEVLS